MNMFIYRPILQEPNKGVISMYICTCTYINTHIYTNYMNMNIYIPILQQPNNGVISMYIYKYIKTRIYTNLIYEYRYINTYFTGAK
jgi:hypothetical protein